MPTKLPDTDPITLSNGDKVYPHELIFIMPKRSIIEERNQQICDITKYMPVGRFDGREITDQLSNTRKGNGIFYRYGKTEKDKRLKIKPHSCRHLQNTELFRKNVSDSIITKRFNRKNVAQSYDYDHRSLAEDLDRIGISKKTEDLLGPNGTDIYKMIKGNIASGPVVNEFKHIQKTQGDDAAITYLAVEADGYHVTPYGICITSFAVNPCPNFLECFNGCAHLTTSPISSHKTNLLKLRERLSKALELINKLPDGQIGKENQFKDLTNKIANIDKILSTNIGEKPFPEGSDLLKRSDSERSILDE